MSSRATSVSVGLAIFAGGLAAQPMERSVQPPKLDAPRPRAQAAAPGLACQYINYFGVADKVPVPAFDGVTSSGWVGAVSYTIQGQASFVPPAGSPPYAAVFLNGQTNSIAFPTPMASVSYVYATDYATTVTAYDVNGNQVAQQLAPGNWMGTAVYEVWSPVTLQTQGNQISSISITATNSSGPSLNNFLGIDNLQYCVAPAIYTVEMTQAIQQLQTFPQLKASLAANGRPPEPIIAGKPGALRVYMNPVYAASAVNVDLSVTGMPDQMKQVNLVPGCIPTTQRYQANSCSSADFYFPPPAGSWTATLTVTDPASGMQIEQDVLPFISQTTQPLVLQAIAVCDDTGLFGAYKCGNVSALPGLIDLLGKLAPTSSVTAKAITTENVIESHAGFNCKPNQTCGDSPWWVNVVAELGRLYTQDTQGLTPDPATSPYTVYFGMVRSFLSDFSGLSKIRSHQAASFSTDPRFHGTVETAPETVAHETGHTLSLTHTNSPVPQTTSAPGCFGFAQASVTGLPPLQTDWPWPATGNSNLGSNLIQSPTGLEVPFDVALKKALDPGVTYEIMSYCDPQWIAPQRYQDEFGTLLIPGSNTSSVARAVPAPRASTPQPFWMVTGSIPPSGPAQIGPLFQYTLAGDTSGGSGSYSLQVQNAAGSALFTQYFDLGTLAPEESGVGPAAETTFAQLVPVSAGAARIVLLDPNGALLTYVSLGGVAPTVAITNPTAGFDGSTPIAWTIADPDSTDFTSRIYYSTNNGATWAEIAEVGDSGTSAMFDFSTLPGTNGATGLIKVLVSDGVNTGQAISPNFSISKKTPSMVQINSPAPNASQSGVDPALLTGTAYDVDDGVLSGGSLSWSSNLQGALGTGSPLWVNLQPGVHTITLTATDSDGNSISATTTLTVGIGPPVLNVTFNTLSAPPQTLGTCIQATMSATAGAQGAPLSSVQYSVDGGNTYTGVPMNQLPFTFVIPGTGYIDLVFSATDASGQFTVEGGTFFNLGTCAALSVPNVVGMTQANATTALTGAALLVGTTTMAASATVPSGTVIGQNPAAASTIATGASNSVNLVVSAGPQIPVPNVVGQTQTNAAAAITGAGLAMGAVTAQTSTTVAAGTVIGETPAAGTAANAAATVNLTVSSGGGLAISAPSALAGGAIGSPYSVVLTPSGGSGNYTWSATGLPAGLGIDNTGTISGTPSGNSGNANVHVTLTDGTYSTTANRSYTLGINAALSISAPVSLPNGMAGATYTATTAKAMGGSGSYTWFVSGLPSGMILNPSTGVISGKPLTNAGSPFSVQVTVEDSNSVTASGTYSLTISAAALAITGPSTLPEGFVGVAYNATTVTAAGGTGNYTWSATGLPGGLSIVPASGVIQGIPASAAGSPFSVTVTVSDGNTTTNAVYSLAVSAYSLCDVYQTGQINVVDVQSLINQALGSDARANDLNGDGVVNVVDVQIVINATIGGTCSAG